MTHSPYYINIDGRLMDVSVPQVMGILNVTPDSFYAGSRKQTLEEIASRARQILEEGATMIDLGAYSSRPGAQHITPDEEMARLAPALEVIRTNHPDAVISVDTFRAGVARRCVREYGAHIINDIAAGEMDETMFDVVAELNVPYIMMHMQGTPQTMQQAPRYENFMEEVFLYFAGKIDRLRSRGVKDIILDPGFGFGKTLDHNYELLSWLQEFSVFELPVLAGVSRKSMITRLLGVTPDEALNGTSALHMVALEKGATLLRAHDVKEAVEVVKIYNKLKSVTHK
ncbi:MAG: dihydropteroate synthase [Bacteroides sp.]|nr:dihydropteroate synthase [Bacteroides sp.]